MYSGIITTLLLPLYEVRYATFSSSLYSNSHLPLLQDVGIIDINNIIKQTNIILSDFTRNVSFFCSILPHPYKMSMDQIT